MQKNNRKKRNNKGFSMVELIIVIAIMAALVGILAPQYIKYVQKSKDAADAQQKTELLNAVKVVAVDINDFDVTISNTGCVVDGTNKTTATTALETILGKQFATRKLNSSTSYTITVGTDNTAANFIVES